MFEIKKNLATLRFLDSQKSFIKDKLICLLFIEIKNLDSFVIESSNEYNDNNYYNYVRLSKINDIPIEEGYGYYKDDEGNILDDYDGEKVVSKKILSDEELSVLFSVCNNIGEGWNDTVKISRDSCLVGTPRSLSPSKAKKYLEETEDEKNKGFKFYFANLLLSKGLSKENFKDDTMSEENFKDEIISAVYFASMTGKRLKPETESLLKHDAEAAYYYAKNVIKGKLPKDVENYFELNSFKNKKMSKNDLSFYELYKSENFE